MSDMESDDQSLREYYEDRDRTAMAEPLTPGQQIVAWWETSTSASEPADLADKIDAEIERLKAALREIASDDLYMRNGASWHDVAKMQDGVRQIAREALGYEE
jgi:hypothetical protein